MELGTGEADVVARALYESLGFDNHEHGPGGVSDGQLLLRAGPVIRAGRSAVRGGLVSCVGWAFRRKTAGLGKVGGVP